MVQACPPCPSARDCPFFVSSVLICLTIKASSSIPSLSLVSLCSNLFLSELGRSQFILVIILSLVLLPSCLQGRGPHTLMLMLSVKSFTLGRLWSFIQWPFWSCQFSPSHHSKCFCVPLQDLAHTAEHFLLSLAAFLSCPITASTAWVVLPCQLPVPSQSLWAVQPVSPVQWSSSWQLLLHLCSLLQHLAAVEAVNLEIAFFQHSDQSCICLKIMQSLLWLLAKIPVPYYN